MYESFVLLGLVLAIAAVAYFIGRHRGYYKGRVDEWFTAHKRQADKRRAVADAYLKGRQRA